MARDKSIITEKKANNAEQRNEINKLKTSHIIYPIIIGLGVVGYMIYNDFNIEAFRTIKFTWNSVFWLMMAIVFMMGRDIGYIIRIKLFSDGQMSWYEAFRVIMLWEFTSAITPSAVGGTSFAVIYVHKAGISVGKSSAMVLLTSFFDELYFIVVFPILLAVIGKTELFSIENLSTNVESSIFTFFIIGYSLKFLYTLFVAYGLFVKPRGLKWILVKVFKIRFLRKWREAAARTGDDIILSSRDLKSKKIDFWIKSFAATFLSWSSRYLVANAIILAFFTTHEHFLLFARQFVMWVMMLVMPTPGGSGFSEYFFKEYLGEFLPVAGVAVIIALIWRFVTYYPYLVIGVIVFPRWLKDKFPIKKKKNVDMTN